MECSDDSDATSEASEVELRSQEALRSLHRWHVETEVNN